MFIIMPPSPLPPHPPPPVSQIRDFEFCFYIDHYVSYSGFTPLHYAVLLDDPKVVSYLLENGADPTIENNRGLLPSDYSTNEVIIALLEKFAVKVTVDAF